MPTENIDWASVVSVPRPEYARLVAAKAKLDMVEKMVRGMDSYALKNTLNLLFSEEDVDE